MSRSRTRLPLAGLMLLFTSGLAGCTEAPADGECDKLLTHLIEIEVNAGKASDEDKAKHKIALREEYKSSFLGRCERDIKDTQVACSLKAKNKEELEACDN